MIKKQLYESDSVDLRIREVIPVSFFNRSPKSIVYSIYRHGDYECIGECDLRFGMDEELYTVNVPKSHWLYRRGEKVKNIYLLTL